MIGLFILYMLLVLYLKFEPSLDYDEKNDNLYLWYNGCGKFEKCREYIKIF